MNGRKFLFNWKVTVFSAACLFVFVNLGFWQLQRQTEKEVMIAERAVNALQPPVTAPALIAGELPAASRLTLTGEFLKNEVLLLDNVVFEGTVGFEVHQVFQDISGMHFLINRGFVPMGRTRLDKVDIPPLDDGVISIEGHIYHREGAPLSLADGQGGYEVLPAIVQQIDIVQFGNHLNLELFGQIIRLAEDQPGALPRYWPDTIMPPEKHFGYALQWFAMAIAVCIAWLFFSFRLEDNQ